MAGKTGENGPHPGACMAAIRRKIARRALTAGREDCPPSEASPRPWRVSPSTVVEAYDRLRAEGMICSRPGSGFYVVRSMPPLALAEVGPRTGSSDGPVLGLPPIARAGPKMLKPGCGWLPADGCRTPRSAAPCARLRRAGRRRADRLRQPAWIAAAAGVSWPASSPLEGLEVGTDQYPADDIGHAGDRPHLPLSATARAIRCCWTIPVITISGRLLRAHRVKVVGVPYTPTGPDLAALRRRARDPSSAPLHHQFRAS